MYLNSYRVKTASKKRKDVRHLGYFVPAFVPCEDPSAPCAYSRRQDHA